MKKMFLGFFDNYKAPFFVAALLLICFFADAQIHQPPTLWGKREFRHVTDSAWQGPTGNGSPTSSNITSRKQFGLYFDSTNKKLWIYNPKTSLWDTLSIGATSTTPGWNLTGNSGTTPGTNFLGTTDAQALQLRTNSAKRFTINTNGAFGLGTGEDYGTSGYLLSTNGSGTAPTWVNPATVGTNIYNSNGTLTDGRTLNGNTETLTFTGLSRFTLNTSNVNSSTSFDANDGGTTIEGAKTSLTSRASNILVNADSIVIRPSLGTFKIDTLTSAVGTKALRYNPTSGLVTYADTTTSSGGTVIGVTASAPLASSGGTAPNITADTSTANTGLTTLYQNGLKANIASPTFTGTLTAPTINVSGLTASQLVATDGSKNLQSLTTATYPSLTELSYVKGVTSAIQTQFASYLPLAGGTYTTTTGNGLALTSSTVTTGNLVSLSNTGTAAASNTKNVLAISSSGANATSTQTVTGQTISVTNTGTSSTNVGLSVSATGGTNNYAIIVPASSGNVGIGTSAPTTRFHVVNTGSAQVFQLDNAAGGFAFGVDALGGYAQSSTVGKGMWFYNNSGSVMGINGSTGYVGVGSTSPNSTLDISGSTGAAIATTTTNLTLDGTHHTVIITGGTPTITLPAAASGNNRRFYRVVNQTGSAVTISSYLDFAGASATTVAANSSILIQSNGTSWYRVQ